MADKVRYIPLGGLGVIGMNCAVLEAGEDIIVLDAGIKIPQEDLPGVDQILPDFSYLLEKRDRVRAVVLTHGHDDHVAGLPHLLAELPLPVFGTALTLAFARNRMADNARGVPFDGRQLLFGQEVAIGAFRVTAAAMTHSIPDAAALVIRTPAGAVVHSGDFKLDQTPVDGRVPDLSRLGGFGGERPLLLLSDSTNAERAGFTPSESEVGPALESLLRAAPGRVFVATFSSHIHRIQQILRAAARTRRRVVMEGRRLEQAVRTATGLGYLEVPPGVAAEWREVEDDPRAVFLTTGTQGEPLAALARIVRGEHKGVEVREGDTVVFSSRVIPGNELTVGRMVNELCRRGARVHYRDSDRVHVSGHASAEELKLLLNLVRPRYFVPVHGEYRHLTAHARLAQATGMDAADVFVLEPGQVLEVSERSARRGGTVPAGRVLVDGETVGDLDADVLPDRRRLARGGVVFVAASLPGEDGGFSLEPAVHSTGVLPEGDRPELDAEAAREVRELLLSFPRSPRPPVEDVRNEIRSRARSVYRRALQKRPHVVAMIVEE